MPARKLLSTVIAGALFLPTLGFTLGLGEIEVNSALNQKLNADIELLSASEEDTENIIVKLASRKEFARAGIDRPYMLSDLRFKPVVIDGVPHIKVTSGSPIREPYLDFLVEVDWPNGHLLREYTVLLDPPVFMMQPASTASAPVNQNAEFRPAAPTATTAPVPVAVPGARPAMAEQAPAQSMPAAQQGSSQTAAQSTYIPAPSPQQQAVLQQRAGQYRIKAGDTAWSLADAMRPDRSVTVEQMMVAMLRANPESFIHENVNGLKRGYILRIPDYNQITAVSHAEARELVREQAALWRQYTQAQRGGEPVSAMPGEAAAAGTTEGEGAVDDEGRLAIVSAGAGSSALGSKDPTQMSAEELRAELALAREAVETERVEKEALLQRINELEQSVNKMQGMISVEDNAMSEVQALNAPAEEGMTAEGGETEAAVEAADEQAEQEQELQEVLSELSDAAPGEESAEAEATEESLQEGEEAGAEAEMEAGSEEAAFTDEAEPQEAGEELVEETVVETEPPVQEPPAPAPIVSRPAQDPLSRILNDPLLLAGGGGGLLLLLVLIGLIIKKRRKAAEEAEVELPVSDTSDDLAGLADDIGTEETAAETLAEESSETSAAQEGGEFDSDATMVMNAQDTVVTEAESEAEEEEEPRDDVIAEADVYLAYGIYQQAEELLTQALADNPERDDYRVKLAETYYASKNKDAFIKVAEELYKRAGGEDTPEWKKVMVMGQDMCADHQMFQGSMVGGIDVDALAPKAPEMDIDLGGDEAADGQAQESSTDSELSLDEPLELPEDEAVDETQVMEAEETSPEIVDELEFDITDTGAVVEEESSEDEFSLDIDANELDIDMQDEEASLELDETDIGLDLDEDTTESGDEIHDVDDVDIDFGLDEPQAETETDENAEEEEEISLDLTEEAEAMDLGMEDFGLDEEPKPAETEVPAEETPDIPAEEEPEAPAEKAEEASEASAETDEDDFDLSSLDDVDEISTKLDLARAYLDMGDHEGARDILEEVQADGNDEQKKEAAELIEKLD